MDEFRIYSLNLPDPVMVAASAGPEDYEDFDFVYGHSNILIGIITQNKLNQYQNELEIGMLREGEPIKDRVFVCQVLEDYKAPEREDLMLFFGKALKALEQTGGKLSIHCGSGCGRSGTFIAALKVLETALTGKINLKKRNYPQRISNDDKRTPEQMKTVRYTDESIAAMMFAKNTGIDEFGKESRNKEYLETGEQLTAISDLSEYLAKLAKKKRLNRVLGVYVPVDLVDFPASIDRSDVLQRISAVIKPGEKYYMPIVDGVLKQLDRKFDSIDEFVSVFSSLKEPERRLLTNNGKNILHLAMEGSLGEQWGELRSQIIVKIAQQDPALLMDMDFGSVKLGVMRIINKTTPLILALSLKSQLDSGGVQSIASDVPTNIIQAHLLDSTAESNAAPGGLQDISVLIGKEDLRKTMIKSLSSKNPEGIKVFNTIIAKLDEIKQPLLDEEAQLDLATKLKEDYSLLAHLPQSIKQGIDCSTLEELIGSNFSNTSEIQPGDKELVEMCYGANMQDYISSYFREALDEEMTPDKALLLVNYYEEMNKKVDLSVAKVNVSIFNKLVGKGINAESIMRVYNLLSEDDKSAAREAINGQPGYEEFLKKVNPEALHAKTSGGPDSRAADVVSANMKNTDPKKGTTDSEKVITIKLGEPSESSNA